MLRVPPRCITLRPNRLNRLVGWRQREACVPLLCRRRFASVTDLHQYPQVGEALHGFTLKRTKQVPELQLTAFHLEHDKTGLEHLHVARDDKNNVFSVGFKTNPPDDTGVPHILEHTTLCGSEKYRERQHAYSRKPVNLLLDILSETLFSRCSLARYRIS